MSSYAPSSLLLSSTLLDVYPHPPNAPYKDIRASHVLPRRRFSISSDSPEALTPGDVSLTSNFNAKVERPTHLEYEEDEDDSDDEICSSP